MRYVLLVIIFFSCTNILQEKDSFLIIKTDLSTNKPFPILIFGTNKYPEKFHFSENFIVTKKQIKYLQRCVERYSDTVIFNLYPTCEITSISNNKKQMYYTNDLTKTKSLFKCLKDACKQNDLFDAEEVTNKMLTKLDGY